LRVTDCGRSKSVLGLALVVAVVASGSGVFRLCLPAAHESGIKLRHALADWFSKEAIDGQMAFEITLACAEAFNNAVEHPIEPALARVEIQGEVTEGELRLSLRDYGRWRDHDDHARERGHGLTLMRALVDSVEIDAADHGSTITLRRRM
jgi:anti-sigma regulatory factor (Ser/Thr protein kinase)